MYTVVTTETFDKAMKKHHKNRKEELAAVKRKLEQYPAKYGKPLRGSLHGTWQIRFGDSFRIWYEIDEEEQTVTLKAVYHKDEARERY
ncbi:MAG: type II toxin-antitoxin system RelE/ParE family toxin [Candidatus Nanohaloarchaea archaeon]|nr:type II toxin-antitoxin system RelE/ParE family toxin [Candidatus Nanohaloarchaea archaeon]